MIDPELRDIIAPELAKGEELLWAGQPQKNPFLYSGIYALVFAIVWIGAILYFEYSWIKGFFFPKDGSSLSAFSFLFGLAVSCLMLLVGYFQLRYAIIHLFGIKKQVYALTSKRGLIVENYWKKRSLSLDKTALSIMHKEIKKSLGTLIFGVPEVLKRKDKHRFNVMHLIRLAPIFYNIENPNEIEALILKHFYLTEQSS